MRDFTWNYFSMTGDVNAYLFYKEMSDPETIQEPSASEDTPEPEGVEVVI